MANPLTSNSLRRILNSVHTFFIASLSYRKNLKIKELFISRYLKQSESSHLSCFSFILCLINPHFTVLAVNTRQNCVTKKREFNRGDQVNKRKNSRRKSENGSRRKDWETERERRVGQGKTKCRSSVLLFLLSIAYVINYPITPQLQRSWDYFSPLFHISTTWQMLLSWN